MNATITETHPSTGLIEGDINAYNISIITSNSPIVVRLNLLNSYAKNLSNAFLYTTNAYVYIESFHCDVTKPPYTDPLIPKSP